MNKIVSAISLLIIVLISASAAPADTARVPASVQSRLLEIVERQRALEAIGDKVVYGDHGSIREISGNVRLLVPPRDARLASGDWALSQLRVALGLRGAESLGPPRLSPVSGRGVSYLQFGQSIAGIPVVNAGLMISIDESGQATRVVSALLFDKNLPRKPRIELGEARGIAKLELSDEIATVAGLDSRLVYFLQEPGVGALAWEFLVTKSSEGCPAESFKVFVDTQTAEIIASWPQQTSAKSRAVYSADSTHSYMHNLVISEGGATSDMIALNVYDKSGMAYNFFSTAFGLDSFDGAGATLTSAVRYSANWAEAKFDKVNEHFLYGDGDAGSVWDPLGNSLDIVVHEFMHAVTFHAAFPELPYEDQSGAIDEALSDIFAAAIDADTNGVSAATWRIGEEVYVPSDLTIAQRYMNDPRDDTGQTSGWYSRDDYQDLYDDEGDNGGVHYNSGIINLAFYLLSEGGSHPRGVTSHYVSGIGIAKAQQIFYNAIPSLNLGEDTKMVHLRNAAAAAANLLYGSAEVDSVHHAFDAVRVPGSPSSVPNVPSSISATSQWCFGWHTVSWASSAGATSYVLRFATDRDHFGSGQLKYSGASTGSHAISVPSTGYLGVQACNSSGCSAFKSSQQLQVYQGCM